MCHPVCGLVLATVWGGRLDVKPMHAMRGGQHLNQRSDQEAMQMARSRPVHRLRRPTCRRRGVGLSGLLRAHPHSQPPSPVPQNLSAHPLHKCMHACMHAREMATNNNNCKRSGDPPLATLPGTRHSVHPPSFSGSS